MCTALRTVEMAVQTRQDISLALVKVIQGSTGKEGFLLVWSLPVTGLFLMEPLQLLLSRGGRLDWCYCQPADQKGEAASQPVCTQREVILIPLMSPARSGCHL